MSFISNNNFSITFHNTTFKNIVSNTINYNTSRFGIFKLPNILKLINVKPSENWAKYSPLSVEFLTVTFLLCKNASLVSR